MSKQHTNTINHFSHKHPLTEVTVVGTYTCDGCKLFGEGKTYRCSDCDYDLHEYCATCPQSLINSCHGPNHELSLINGPTHMTERGYYVCRVHIQGMFYKCKHCSFESYPLFTHVPLHSSSPDATLIKQRSLHQPDHVSQPSSPHHYGQGNSYGYPTMTPYWSYPHGGHYYDYHHQRHPNMNPCSPKADLSQGPSTPKTKKKNQGMFGAARAAAVLAAGVATNLLVAAVADSVFNEE